MSRVVALLLLLLAAPAAAQERSLTLQDFSSDVHVRPDATLDVREVLRVRFDGAWKGIFRDLSLRHRTADGKRARLDVEVLGVTDGAGQPLRYEFERKDASTRRVKIWVPDAADTVRTVAIRYRVRNGLRFFAADSAAGTPAFDELYWNVTGDTWEMPIQRASVHVALPAGVHPLQVAAYTGQSGSRESAATIDTAGGGVTVQTTRALQPGEQLTVGVGWPAGVVARPTPADRARAGVLGWWPVLLPLLAFWGMFRFWRRRGRDPEARPIAVRYEPPEGMTPAELGTLIDGRAEMHDITSTVVDLAVRGFLRIEEHTESKLFGLAKETDYVFGLTRPRAEWAELLPHERSFLGALFATGDTVRLSELKEKFYTSLSGIRDDIYAELMRRGFYQHRPDRARVWWVSIGLAMLPLGLFAVVGVVGSDLWGISPWAVGIAFALSGLVVAGFGWVMPARTEPGARAMEAALGFREFLERVESDRFRRMITGPEMFERFLPYAMAFRVEERWARAFEGLVREPPDWYSGNGSGAFHAHAFASQMSSMTSRAASTFSSSRSSSGSGGGGFAGGGSGGGGGGGF